MPDIEIEKTQRQLDEAFAVFESEHPEVADAMKAMGISFYGYLQALAALKETPSTSGNASS